MSRARQLLGQHSSSSAQVEVLELADVLRPDKSRILAEGMPVDARPKSPKRDFAL